MRHAWITLGQGWMSHGLYGLSQSKNNWLNAPTDCWITQLKPCMDWGVDASRHFVGRGYATRLALCDGENILILLTSPHIFKLLTREEEH